MDEHSSLLLPAAAQQAAVWWCRAPTDRLGGWARWHFGCHLATGTGDGLGSALLAAWPGAPAMAARSQSSHPICRVISWDRLCWRDCFRLGKPFGVNGLLVAWVFLFQMLRVWSLTLNRDWDTLSLLRSRATNTSTYYFLVVFFLLP